VVCISMTFINPHLLMPTFVSIGKRLPVDSVKIKLEHDVVINISFWILMLSRKPSAC